MDEIYILDVETTGLNGFRPDYPIEISVVMVRNSEAPEVVFDAFVKQPSKKFYERCWWYSKMGIPYHEVQKKGKDIKVIWKELHAIVNDKCVLSWNTSFDFDKFLTKMNSILKPTIKWKILPCLMKFSTNIIGIPHEDFTYKYPSLSEAVSFFDISNSPGRNFHRASTDALATAQILKILISQYNYKVKNCK